jgi:hypothetical protein
MSSTVEQTRNTYQILIRESPLVVPRRKVENCIEVTFRELGCNTIAGSLGIVSEFQVPENRRFI